MKCYLHVLLLVALFTLSGCITLSEKNSTPEFQKRYEELK
jgi:outer membrane biogenesis lipoprotein LolB